MNNIGELIEKLCIANIKLYMLCDKKVDMAADPLKYSKEEIAALLSKDIALCKERASLKSEINKILGAGGEEVKMYGN